MLRQAVCFYARASTPALQTLPTHRLRWFNQLPSCFCLPLHPPTYPFITPVAQALMEQWRAELQRKPLSMSEGQACEALGLTPGPDGRVEEDDMRRAYRGLARRCVSVFK